MLMHECHTTAYVHAFLTSAPTLLTVAITKEKDSRIVVVQEARWTLLFENPLKETCAYINTQVLVHTYMRTFCILFCIFRATLFHISAYFPTHTRQNEYVT
jgi:hypothetical protein